MEKFIRKPSIDMYLGIRVDKDTKLDFENENVKQHLTNLVLHTVQTIKGEGYESTYDTTIYLKDGDILIFEEEGRGYVKPYEPFTTVKEAIEDFEIIKEL